VKLTVIASAAGLLAATLMAQTDNRPRLRPVPQAGQNMKTGPEVGARIPSFSLPDQDGKSQSLESLRGPNGLMLAFVRSADW